MVLVMQNGALDFHTRQRITASQMQAQEIDAHHIFPQAWLKREYSGDLSGELILNRTLIDAETNRVISDNAPSSYLQDMRTGSIGPNRDRLLKTHVIDNKSRDAMLADDYDAFIAARTRALVAVIEKVTGKSVIRDLTA
ncbi:hypothetical protein [Modestobacter versicolor]|uniref:DUF1524 domain-containing protein n=1 Tax=Modestobacter versicolor TaxID=429133 RepID=A0A839XUU3_9ACTN|nr:hypothetical protein [Modestobacter versicolor]MBB3674359.1 hypothetical protein [Modestobacter versicolor]